MICLLSVNLLNAQNGTDETPRVMNEGTLIGFGSSHVKDTYLSPFNYSGWGLRILNERIKNLDKGHFSRQQIINVDISSTKNPAENVTDFGAFVDYTLGYHYRFHAAPSFRILAGASGHLMGGFLYNTRNGNNPLSAKVDIDLNLSVLMLWNVRVKRHQLTFRYQADMPFVGAFFAPDYGASYYEMFNVGNLTDVIAFNSFHNKFAMRNYLTLDIPLSRSILRVGYLNSIYKTDVKEIQSHVISHSFMIGWVKEFIPLGGKRSRHTQRTHSPFY